MKKVILFLILCFGFISLQAQTVLPIEKYIFSYVGISTDTVGVGTTVLNKAIQLNKLDGIFYNAKVKVSDVTAGATCTIALQGKIFSSDTYTTINTYTWYGGGTDTTVLFTSNTNKVYWRYLNFKITRTANKAKLTSIDLSIKK